jgi:protease I
MKKLGIVIDNGFHDLELWIPYYRFREENIPFDVLAYENRDYKGVYGVDSIKPTRLLGEIDSGYDLVYLPGANSPENLLKHPETVGIIRKMSSSGTSFATICHGPLLLAEAGLLKGLEVTGHPSIKTEMEKNGASYVDRPYVRSSDKIMCGRTHFEIDHLIPEMLRFIRDKRPDDRPPQPNRLTRSAYPKGV